MTRQQLEQVISGPLNEIIDSLNCLIQNAGGTTSALESDPQLICVTGAPPTQLIQWVVKLDGVPNGTVIYTNLSGAVVGAPGAGTFTFGACSVSDTQVFQRCLCDDVNGDGSIIFTYIEFYQYDPATNSITVTGTWNETLTAIYVPVNPVDCDSLGNPIQIVQRRLDLIGVTNWVRPVDAQAVTLKVRRVGSVLTPPTITDNNGTITPLFLGDVESWSIIDGDSTVLQGTFSVTNNNAGDYITINYTQII